MDLFKKLAQVLSEGEDLTIVTRKKANGQLVVSVLVNDNGVAADSKAKTIPPFILKGTPEELDEGFVASIEQPLSEAVGLFVNVKAAKDAISKAASAGKAAEPAKTASSPKKSSSKKSPVKAAEDENGKAESLIPANEAETEVEEVVVVPDPEPVEAPAEEKQPEPVADVAEEAAAPEAGTVEVPSAPEAEEVITKDVNTLWKEGKEYYGKGDYKNALRVFEQCRAVAKASQYSSIDKAIDNCTAKLASDLFNPES